MAMGIVIYTTFHLKYGKFGVINCVIMKLAVVLYSISCHGRHTARVKFGYPDKNDNFLKNYARVNPKTITGDRSRDLANPLPSVNNTFILFFFFSISHASFRRFSVKLNTTIRSSWF